MKIDLDSLRRSAERTDTDEAKVSRRWLRQAHADLVKGAAAIAELAALKGPRDGAAA